MPSVNKGCHRNFYTIAYQPLLLAICIKIPVGSLYFVSLCQPRITDISLDSNVFFHNRSINVLENRVTVLVFSSGVLHLVHGLRLGWDLISENQTSCLLILNNMLHLFTTRVERVTIFLSCGWVVETILFLLLVDYLNTKCK